MFQVFVEVMESQLTILKENQSDVKQAKINTKTNLKNQICVKH